jgi:hypothetical protein
MVIIGLGSQKKAAKNTDQLKAENRPEFSLIEKFLALSRNFSDLRKKLSPLVVATMERSNPWATLPSSVTN